MELRKSKVRYPHRVFEVGSIALSSCWWARIANSFNCNIRVGNDEETEEQQQQIDIKND